MNSVTAIQLVSYALKKAGVLGVGQTALSEDANDAFFEMNAMLAQWQRKRWLVYHLVDVSCQATGATSYNVGIGLDFNVARPDRLEAAYFRNNVSSPGKPVDYPLEIIESREDYSTISVKTLGTWPAYAFYDPAFPTGVLYPWPVPATTYELHIVLKEQLQSFTNLSDTVLLPPEYYMAILYNLAARLRPSYQLPPDPTVIALADESLAVIRGANTQVPTLQMPRGISGGGGYNILSDTGR